MVSEDSFGVLRPCVGVVEGLVEALHTSSKRVLGLWAERGFAGGLGFRGQFSDMPYEVDIQHSREYQ